MRLAELFEGVLRDAQTFWHEEETCPLGVISAGDWRAYEDQTTLAAGLVGYDGEMYLEDGWRDGWNCYVAREDGVIIGWCMYIC